MIVDGALYKVVPTIFRKKRSVSSKSNSQRDRSRSKSNLGDTDLDNVSKHGSQPGESTKSAWDNVAVVKAEEATEDHIQLERYLVYFLDSDSNKDFIIEGLGWSRMA